MRLARVQLLLILTLSRSLACLEVKTPLKKSFSIQSLFIAPGTLWCGAGTMAATCDDFGEYIETDKCCREHDTCPYTFTSRMTEFNGFSSDILYTTSHCECDKIFYDCLHAQPYNSHSYEIWDTYSSLGVKCFAYLPCGYNDDEDRYDDYARFLSDRRTGSCVNNNRVVLFETIFDYNEFLMERLRREELEHMNRSLDGNQELFMSDAKKIGMCRHKFPDYGTRIVENFAGYFFNTSLPHHESYNTKFTSKGFFRETVDIYPRKVWRTKNRIEDKRPLILLYIFLALLVFVVVMMTFVVSYLIKLCSRRYVAVHLEYPVSLRI